MIKLNAKAQNVLGKLSGFRRMSDSCWSSVCDQRQPFKSKREGSELFLYDEIGASLWGGISASDVAEMLADVQEDEQLTVRINSPGGDVFDGIAIHNLLDERPNVTTKIDGEASSAASIIAMAGKNRIAAKASSMMIHNPWTIAAGEARDFRELADVLDQVGNTLANVYSDRSGMDASEAQKLMDAETWFDPDGMLSKGLIDEIAGAVTAQNQGGMARLKFRQRQLDLTRRR